MNTQPFVEHLRMTFPNLMAVYLFGSHAQGHAGPQSDLDLAVLLDGQATALQLWPVAGELADLAGREVDLLDLRAASTVMQYQVLTHGQRLWAKDARVGIFEAFILGEKTRLDEARAGLLSDIAKDGHVYGR
ncbi:type VII toxin-antitoxin system MntA family adenylyltransferase antitoxin [Pseudomonas sp. nanlin1]|uniref:type VII toxin-antitoxin system MntA family adenylyltransferase antitoxin n=1 Tax=Pseudomonas sp. nanlin1 TaxID=3040605 RepID=UPI00388E0C0E